jgi:hypothetical protein
MRKVLLIGLLVASGCSSPGGPYPSLQPRTAERIDPRVPVEKAMNHRPASAGLTASLRSLVDQARGGEPAFDSAAAEAERLAQSAGASQSESWIQAQEALTAAVAARKPIASALADIDEMGARALQTQGGLAPNDLAAIDLAASEVAAIDQRQAERIKAIQGRLGP